jgi:hypothetical protein
MRLDLESKFGKQSSLRSIFQFAFGLFAKFLSFKRQQQKSMPGNGHPTRRVIKIFA